MAYSLDLRERVIDAVSKGENKRSVAERYNVSRGTVHNWIRRPILSPSKAGPKKPWRLDMLRLQVEVDATPDAYLDEFALRLGVCVATVHHGFKRLNITRKKNDAVRSTR
jgi:putative transposase